jgi:hypothetical protein
MQNDVALSLKGYLWLTVLNLTGQDNSTTRRFRAEAETIGNGRTVP